MSKLHTLTKITSKSAKRLGRGIGSGVGGHTVGRGAKGQKARNSVPLWFEGGQLPLIKRLPMLRGKGQLQPLKVVELITLSKLEKIANKIVTVESLRAARLIASRTKLVKVVASGTLTQKVSLQGIKVSAAARKIIEGLGGEIK